MLMSPCIGKQGYSLQMHGCQRKWEKDIKALQKNTDDHQNFGKRHASDDGGSLCQRCTKIWFSQIARLSKLCFWIWHGMLAFHSYELYSILAILNVLNVLQEFSYFVKVINLSRCIQKSGKFSSNLAWDFPGIFNTMRQSTGNDFDEVSF